MDNLFVIHRVLLNSECCVCNLFARLVAFMLPNHNDYNVGLCLKWGKFSFCFLFPHGEGSNLLVRVNIWNPLGLNLGARFEDSIPPRMAGDLNILYSRFL